MSSTSVSIWIDKAAEIRPVRGAAPKAHPVEVWLSDALLYLSADAATQLRDVLNGRLAELRESEAVAS